MCTGNNCNTQNYVITITQNLQSSASEASLGDERATIPPKTNTKERAIAGVPPLECLTVFGSLVMVDVSDFYVPGHCVPDLHHCVRCVGRGDGLRLSRFSPLGVLHP